MHWAWLPGPQSVVEAHVSFFVFRDISSASPLLPLPARQAKWARPMRHGSLLHTCCCQEVHPSQEVLLRLWPAPASCVSMLPRQ